VLKTIEELVKETTYLEVSVLYLFFQQTRRLKKKFKITHPPVILIYFLKPWNLVFRKPGTSGL